MPGRKPPSTTPTPPEAPSQGGWSEPGVAVDRSAAATPITDTPRYTLGLLLGRGGMGAVHSARDAALGREVALKAVLPELSGNAIAQARLAREAAITSRLDHPGIVSVHDAGHLPDGRPFYTMRLVRGQTLARAAADAQGPEARRQLVRHVLAAAEALAAAHDAGIVHRDVKPTNILIGLHGETQVADWGLSTPMPAAVARWPDLPEGSERGAVGTHAYMAPEQARGAAPDPQHDVWSLGKTLAEVVGGGEPLPPELAAIVDRATIATSDARYPDAGAFAADLLRWFEGRQVHAYSYSRSELLRRAVRAYRLPIVVGAAGLLAVGIASVVGVWRTNQSLHRALRAEQEANDNLADLQLEQAVVATRAGAREPAERLALQALRHRDDPLARGVFAAFGRAERPKLLTTAAVPPCDWFAMPAGGDWMICGDESGVTRMSENTPVWRTPLNAVGAVIRDGVVLAWDAIGTSTALDAATGAIRETRSFFTEDWLAQVEPRHPWTGSTFLPLPGGRASTCRDQLRVATIEGNRLAALCSDGTLLLGNRDGVVDRRVPTALVGDHVAASLAWTPTGLLLAGSLRGQLYILDGETGEQRATTPTELGTLSAIRVSEDGRFAALSGTLGGVAVLRIDSAAVVGVVPAERPRAFAFSDDGLVVVDTQRRTWMLPVGSPALIRTNAGLADVAIDPAGSVVALSGGDGVITRADLRDGSTSQVHLGDRVVKAAAFSPDGTDLIVTGMGAPWLSRWSGNGPANALHSARPLRRLVWTNESVVGVDLDAGVYVWPDPHGIPQLYAADRRFIDAEVDGSTAYVLDTAGRIEKVTSAGLEPFADVGDSWAIDVRGASIAIASQTEIKLRGPDGNRSLPTPGDPAIDVALSADGTRVAAAGLLGVVYVWDVATGNLLGVLPGHLERVVSLEFLPDGDLVSASWDRTARVWELDALTAGIETLESDVEQAWGIATTADK